MIISPREVTLKNGALVTLRSVRPDEALAFLEHLRTAHRESYRNLNRTPEYWDNMAVEEEERILTGIGASKRRFMMGALLNGKFIGGLSIFGHENSFQEYNGMLGISTQKAFHGTGLGTAMIKYAIEQCQMAGLHRLELSVRVYNTNAIALYEKLGFRKIGTLREIAFVDGKFVDEFMYDYLL